MNSLVSIITPCHNSSKFIGECIESVMAQDYPHWEMLITDDGSTDDTVAIIEKFVRKDSRIKLFRLDKASGSPAAPRNNSIRMAKGEYIAFLDSDDIWLPQKLSEQIAFAQVNNYSVVFSFYEKISDIGKRQGRVVMTDVAYDYDKIIKTDGVPWLTLIIRKDAINGLSFIKAEKEDYLYLMSLLRRGNTAYNTCKIHALYRETQSSRSCNKWKMLCAQWVAIRKYEKIGFIKSIYCIIIYAINGLKKRII